MLIEKIKVANKFLFKNIVIVVFLLVLLYIFIGSDDKNNQYDGQQQYATRSLDASNNSIPMLKASSMSVGNYEIGSKIVKGYGLTIEVKDTSNIYSLITNEVAKVNGFVDSFYSYNYVKNELAYNFVLKIPTEKIINNIEYFKSLGLIKNESSDATDLTEQYSDNENRLKNLNSRRDRLRKMMDNKTEKLSDILAVDRELSNVQIEIERLENTNQKIDTNVEYSKLELNILPEIKVSSLNNSEWRVSTSWKKAVNKFIIFGQKGIDYTFEFITLLPIIIIFIILILLIKKITNKTK
ncbi:MAG: DUF4349 domain-containing protein [Rickettsiales bacterium]|nr:DUF4349 domain-containing protein [Rickettsiales bacterium]